ncbi:MAG TPA: DUF2076 family protein [Steroidobacteraceae bacterium]
MTPQERSLLEGFLAQLAQVRGLNKDPEAERLIAQAVQQQPDATYLVVQRALLLGQALEQAKARIAALEQGEGRGQGFLDPTIPGGGNASGWGNPGSGPAGYRGQPAPAAPPQYAPAYAPAYGAPPPGYPAYGAPPSGGGFSSFLGQAAATAAGVAGGEFLFQGIENMFGGHHGGGFGGGGYANEALPTEDVTINNYYGPDEVVVDNTIDRPQPDDSDATFSNDDVLGDDQDFV